MINDIKVFLIKLEYLLRFDVPRDVLIEAKGALLFIKSINNDFKFEINNLLNKIEYELRELEPINWEEKLDKEIELSDKNRLNKIPISYSGALKIFRSRVTGNKY